MLQHGAERPEALDSAIRLIGTAIEVGGVAMLVLTAIVATLLLFRDWWRERTFAPAYKAYRRNLGRGILLGLEFLVIGDIIGTVAVEPSFENLGVLGLIVIIRTFLSFSLEVEIEGRLPWKSAEDGRRREEV